MVWVKLMQHTGAVLRINFKKTKLIMWKGDNDMTFYYICLIITVQLVYHSHNWFSINKNQYCNNYISNYSHSFTYYVIYKPTIPPFFEIKILFWINSEFSNVGLSILVMGIPGTYRTNEITFVVRPVTNCWF